MINNLSIFSQISNMLKSKNPVEEKIKKRQDKMSSKHNQSSHEEQNLDRRKSNPVPAPRRRSLQADDNKDFASKEVETSSSAPKDSSSLSINDDKLNSNINNNSVTNSSSNNNNMKNINNNSNNKSQRKKSFALPNNSKSASGLTLLSPSEYSEKDNLSDNRSLSSTSLRSSSEKLNITKNHDKNDSSSSIKSSSDQVIVSPQKDKDISRSSSAISDESSNADNNGNNQFSQVSKILLYIFLLLLKYSI